MKKLLMLLPILISLTSSSQDAKKILQKCYEKCQSIKNGYYDMDEYMKFMSGKDTTKSFFTCYFKKLKDDTTFSFAFNRKSVWNDTSIVEEIYTGNEYVIISAADSSATITQKTKWAEYIQGLDQSNNFYTPFTNKKSSPLLHDSNFIDNKHFLKFIGEEKLNKVSCFHIQVNELDDIDSNDDGVALRIEYHFWIKKNDYIPVQYSLAIDIVINNDTMYQYEKFVLNKYEINNLKDEKVLSLNYIPAIYKTKDYVPDNYPKLLPVDTIAPDWDLISLTNEKISLKDMKGQLVLIDFFYKSCAPCMKALPALQVLNKKYKDKGLRVISIDPNDDKYDDMPTFLGKRGVTYTILLGGKDAAKDYHVSGYPTMYLIDKNGKFIFVQEGYGKGVEDELEEIIKKNL